MRKTKKSNIVSIRLAPAVSARITQLSKERNQSVSDIIRSALEAFEQNADSPFLRVAGVFDSGVSDLSTNPKHLNGFGR